MIKDKYPSTVLEMVISNLANTTSEKELLLLNHEYMSKPLLVHMITNHVYKMYAEYRYPLITNVELLAIMSDCIKTGNDLVFEQCLMSDIIRIESISPSGSLVYKLNDIQTKSSL